MSDKDRPSDIWGRGERTIIRPNPGARRPVAPPAQPPAAADPNAPPAQPSISYPAPSPATPASTQEEWIATPAQQQAPPPSVRAAPELRIEELVAPNANPIMRAGQPLLLLLGRLRVALMRASFASLMEQVADAIKFFEKDIRSAGIPEAQATQAKYILCATADDIVQNIPTEDRHVWTQYSMLSRFFGERIGGVRFFEELDHAKMDPLVNYPVLELQHACLALGFQGIHRTSAGGQATLQQIQRNLYELLRRVRPRVNTDLSPHWRGQALASMANKIRVPTWAVVAVAGLLLFALYGLLRLWLSGGAELTSDALGKLHPDTKLALMRRVIAPPPPPPPPPPQPVDRLTQLQRIRKVLAPEIASGLVTAEQNTTQIFIRVGDLVLFNPGQTSVLDSFKPVIPRIAAALNPEPGNIKVVGHTDNTPIKTIRFPSNWHLSVERAKVVGNLLKQYLAQPDRVEVDGKGATAPIASNDNAQGRARNRRVEIMIPRED
jgi:type VI secretion system protein ImpK